MNHKMICMCVALIVYHIIHFIVTDKGKRFFQHNEMSIWNKNAASDNNNRTGTKVKQYCPRAQIIEDILLELENKAGRFLFPSPC